MNSSALPSPAAPSARFSISSGSRTNVVTIANRNVNPASIMYGARTDRASSAVVAPAAIKINAAPILGAIVVAKEFNPPHKFNRDDAVSGLPSAPTYGLIATCNSASPLPSTNSANRNSGYEIAIDAGTNP